MAFQRSYNIFRLNREAAIKACFWLAKMRSERLKGDWNQGFKTSGRRILAIC